MREHRMPRRGLVAGAGLSLLAAAAGARAQGRFLILPDERAASRKAGELDRAGPRDLEQEGGPRIDIVVPLEGGRIVSPVDFDVRFTAVAPARIDPASIRVLYGWLGLDITARLREFGGRVDAAGIFLPRAPLQPDSYRVAMEVADTQRRRTRRTVNFIVD